MGRRLGLGGGWGGWGPFEEDATTFTSEHPHDILILTISMADAKQKMLVWRGQASAWGKLFKSYPPKTK